MREVSPLANEFVTVFESPDPAAIYTGSPGLCVCPDDRLVGTLDLRGPGVVQLPGIKTDYGNRAWQGKVFTSDDRGRKWSQRADFPFEHARPFVAGGSIYVLGHMGDLMIIRSDDWGQSWSDPVGLTDGQHWHGAPCNVHYANGSVYLVMEKYSYSDVQGWDVSVLAPVLMRAEQDADLTRTENWTFATELCFRDAVHIGDVHYLGVPFFGFNRHRTVEVAPGRGMASPGWLEANVVQFTEPAHYWYDPTGHTFHLWMRAHTGGTNLAALAKVVESPDGAMTTMLEEGPSGKKMVFVPCPGGHLKFHILYDDATQLFWLLSNQSTDSMTRAELLEADRYNLPNDERHRLQLHFSRNCIDWCFAGLVAAGDSPLCSRSYPSMVIDGDALHILSRSGDQQAHSAHDSNLITFHTVEDFRELAY